MDITMLSLEQAAVRLGMKKATLQNKISNGTLKFPTEKIGRHRYIAVAVLDAYFASLVDRGLQGYSEKKG